MKLFWFSKLGTSDSFSRIGENILPILKNNKYELYSIFPPHITPLSYLFVDCIKMGDDIPSLELREKDFVTDNSLSLKMMYTMLQVLVYCFENQINNLFILMGVYESDILIDMIKKIKLKDERLRPIRVILYIPFDYAPTPELLKNILDCDILLVTTDYIKNLIKFPKVFKIGHGVDCRIYKIDSPREKLVDELNSQEFWLGNEIKNDDIIILNANKYGKRKRIDLTIKAFEYAVKHFKKTNIRLWLHESFSKELYIPESIKNNIIISYSITTEQLNLIYNVCQVGLQTSWGEGWSLTNCEHGKVGGLQVVPDWLACKMHFDDSRGLLIDVNKEVSKNEGNHDIIIGVPKQESINKKLMDSLDLIYYNMWDPTKTINYLNEHNWETETKKIIELLNEE